MRDREANLNVFENMSSREPMYSAEQALEQIWNDSGDEGDLFDGNESEFDVYSASEDESDEFSADASSSRENSTEDSEESSDDEAQGCGDGGNRVRQRPARPARRQEAPLVWRMARGTTPRDIPFTGNSGVQVQTEGFQPYDFFALFINNDLLNCFVTETNRYAEQYLAENNLTRGSRANDWHPTDITEIKQFLGLFFLMGIVHKPAIHMYWSKDPLFCTPIYNAVMSRNRFQLLLKFLHFNDNSHMPAPADPSPDKLFKLRPLLDHLFEKFQVAYVPSCNISIDESLLLWKGRLSFKQYIPLKRARFEVKSFMLCEDSGYTFSLKIYTGRENVAPAVQDLSLSERVVADLMQPLLNKGYHLYTDNWYTSLPLYKYLHRQGTLACGTIRSNRKGFPEQVKNAKLRKDEQIACRSDELLALKFKDKKDVFMLSTIHDDSMVNRPDRRHRN